MQEKRERNMNYQKAPEKDFHINLIKDTNKEDNKNSNKFGEVNVTDTLNRLNHYNPKINYKLKRNMVLTDIDRFSDTDFKISNFDNQNFDKLKCDLPPRKSGYMSNTNDYKISEADKLDDNKFFHFERKPEVRYNLVKDKIETVQGPPYDVPKWNAFYEK